MNRDTRVISWIIKAVRKVAETFPESAQEQVLQALNIAAEGQTADIAKPMKGFGSGVFEISVRDKSDAYRVVYACRSAKTSGSCMRSRKSRKPASPHRKRKTTRAGNA